MTSRMECIGHREATLVNSAGDDFNDDRDDDRCGNGVDGFFDLRLESAEAAERGARCRGDNNQDESNNTPGLNINMGQNGSNNRPVLGDYVMPVIQGRVLTRTHPQARFFRLCQLWVAMDALTRLESIMLEISRADAISQPISITGTRCSGRTQSRSYGTHRLTHDHVRVLCRAVMLGLIGIADNNDSSNFCSKVLLLFLVVFVFYFLPLLFHFTECLVIWMTHALGTKMLLINV